MSLTRAKDIQNEASILSRLYSDFDNYRRFYSMVEKNDDEEILIHFVAPKLFLFEEYRFTLLKNSTIKQLQPDHYYRPDYVSYEEYGTINFWALILFINNIPTIEDFDVETIKVPTKHILLQLTNAASRRQPLKEIVPLSELPPKDTPSLYYRKKSIPVSDVKKLEIIPQATQDIYFQRETFTLDIVDVQNRYIDLEYEPVSESLFLDIANESNYLKGKHYDLIRGKKGKNRLTWDPRKIYQGIGLMNVMTEGVQFEVSYAKKI